MVLILWEEAVEHWASLPPSGEMGTCTIALSGVAGAITLAGTPVEVVQSSVFIGAAQVDV